jgi:hypothetical protein
MISNESDSLLQGLEVIESIIGAYQEACRLDSNYRYVKRPILSGPSEIWMQPEKQFDEEDYLYRDDLYHYLGGCNDEKSLSDLHINHGIRRSMRVHLGRLRLTGRQERWSPDFHRLSENHPSREHLLHREYRNEQ